jgi:hypothetical protein
MEDTTKHSCKELGTILLCVCVWGLGVCVGRCVRGRELQFAEWRAKEMCRLVSVGHWVTNAQHHWSLNRRRLSTLHCTCVPTEGVHGYRGGGEGATHALQPANAVRQDACVI